MTIQNLVNKLSGYKISRRYRESYYFYRKIYNKNLHLLIQELYD